MPITSHTISNVGHSFIHKMHNKILQLAIIMLPNITLYYHTYLYLWWGLMFWLITANIRSCWG